MGLFSKIKEGLLKTRKSVVSQIGTMLKSFSKIDEELFEDLEEILISGDVGVNTSSKICNILREKVKSLGIKEPAEIINLLKEITSEMLEGNCSLNFEKTPAIILVVGVNGVGKTTTIGKLAMQLKNQGKKVILSAADTFRAAAIDQLQIWADKANVEMVRQEEGSDPASVIFDTISAAKARNCDVIICDTAGRLHNKKNLMNELEKINRVIKRELPENSFESLLVLDATTGQNALNQAKEFKKVSEITGVVLTKLDGDSRGGSALSVVYCTGKPIKLTGTGEKLNALEDFYPERMATRILGMGDIVSLVVVVAVRENTVGVNVTV